MEFNDNLEKLRKISEKLIERDAHFEQILRYSKISIFTKDPFGRYTYANQECADTMQVPREEIIGKTDKELWPADIAEALIKIDSEIIINKKPTATVEELPAFGRLRKFLCYKFPLIGINGSVIGGISIRLPEDWSA